MIKYILDTDILSKQRGAGGANIRRWLASIDDDKLAISVISLFEISRGVQRKRDDGDTKLADALQAGLDVVKAAFAGRIVVIDTRVAERWGAIAGSDRRQWMDRGLIAIAQHHSLVLVTCNSRDMKGRGAEVIDPSRNKIGRWTATGSPVAVADRTTAGPNPATT